MATAVRHRIPFRFSEDDGQDGPILDEQEQEELIENLRKADESSNLIYHVGLEAVIGLSLVLHVSYLLSSRKVSPLAVLLPDSPSEPVPFASFLTLVQILLHVHLGICCLPPLLPNHSYHGSRRVVSWLSSLHIPLPLYHPITLGLPLLGPAYALLLGRGLVDVLWWGVPAVITGVVAPVTKWVQDGEKDLQELEKLRYTARGA